MKEGTKVRLLTPDEFKMQVSGLTAAQIDKIIATLELNRTDLNSRMG